MKNALVFLAILSAATWAAALDTNMATRIRAEVASAGMQSLPDLTWIQGSTPLVEFMPQKNGRAVSLSTNVRCRMLISSNLATGATWAQVTNTVVTTNATASSLYCQWGAIGTNSAGTGTTAGAWGYLAFFEDGTGTRYWNGGGRLYIEPSTSTDGGLTWQSATSYNAVAWGNVYGDIADNADLVGYIAASAGEDSTARAGVAGVESNLTAHVDDTDNPHGITAEQLGALTAEADPEFFGWEPTAHVPVVCSGGWLYPDYFTVSTTPYAETGITYGETSEYNSILFAWQSITPQKGEVLDLDVIHQSDWTSEVVFTNEEILTIREGEEGVIYADWPDGTESGAVGRVTAVLGDFSRTIELTYPGATAAKSNAWWVGDLEGSFRAAVNSVVSNLASATGTTAYVFTDCPPLTNFVRNTNCWAASLDLTCASPWNSAGLNYYAGTAVTPQHFLYAAHFSAPTNTTFRWIDTTNGIHDRTLVAQRFLGNDIALGLLDSALPAAITPAKTLSIGDIGRLRGRAGLRNAPGFKLVYLDQGERAWQAATPFMETFIAGDFEDSLFFSGSTNLPFSRYKAIGGDSGNPIFLTEGTNAILLSTFCTPTAGPMIPAFREKIEAAMISMGGSVYTNLTAADLSMWTNYDDGTTPPDY